MFLEKYLNDFYLNQVFEIYEDYFLESLDENNFKEIYSLFNWYGFYYINDIIVKYLEIFTMDLKSVRNGINKLHAKLGDNYIKLIGDNLTYLDLILDEIDYD